jgi:GNAT superfamily N-acetyltransferase
MIPRPVAPDYTGWDIVLRLILDSFAYMEGRIDPPSSAHRLTAPEMAEQAGTGAVWVVEEAGCPIACLFAKAAGDALYLGKLAVSTSHRGRGLARRLVAVAEEEARSRCLVWLELETRIELTENHAAFTRLGFMKVAETAHPGYARPTSITMRKRL